MQENIENQESTVEESTAQTMSSEENLGAPIATEPPKEEDWQDKYIRLYSEFDNFRKRTAREKTEWMKTAGEDILKKILPILDDFERAMQAHGGATTEKTPFEEGIYLIFNKLKNTFENVGLKEMDRQNKNFNSDYHEAIAKVKVNDPLLVGQIVDVVEKGYLFNGKIIRYAKVVIGE